MEMILANQTPRTASLLGGIAHRATRGGLLLCAVLCVLMACFNGRANAQGAGASWRPATAQELQAVLPARATVVSEHIETEMRTASGITDGHGKFIAAAVLITAGYAADGKYSHYFITQVPLQIGGISFRPGEYVLGWKREADSLHVRFYEAATGDPHGEVQAAHLERTVRVESLRVWPPQTESILQIGRFGIPYKLEQAQERR